MPKHRLSREEMLANVLDKLKPGHNTYEHFTYLGRLPVPPTVGSPSIEAPVSKFIQYFDDVEWFRKEAADLVVAKNSVITLDVSVRKMDKPIVRDYLNCEFYEQSVKIVLEKFSPGLMVDFMSLDGALHSMDLKKASGYAWRLNGYKKKYQCVKTGLFLEFLDFDNLQTIPIWMACGKEREFLFRGDYVGLMKQRTFIVEPFELLLAGKIVYGNQSEAMKGCWWSAYGMNPYQGGVNNMASKLNKFKRKTMFDVKGYDRLFPHLRDVFRIKNACLGSHPFKEWVTNNRCKSRVVLPNGDFIEKDWGNNSGSGSTTVDNIIGMAIVLVHLFLRLGVPEQEIDDLVWCYLFGDDVVMGDNVNISDEEFKAEVVYTFGLYGFVLDPLVISKDLADMEFLGFRFQKIGAFWVPKYDLGTLCFGFVHGHGKMSTVSEISKFCSILLMSAGHGECIYNKFRSELINVLVNIDHKDLNYLKLNDFRAIPTYECCINWYCGLECLFVENLEFFKFCL